MGKHGSVMFTWQDPADHVKTGYVCVMYMCADGISKSGTSGVLLESTGVGGITNQLSIASSGDIYNQLQLTTMLSVSNPDLAAANASTRQLMPSTSCNTRMSSVYNSDFRASGVDFTDLMKYHKPSPAGGGGGGAQRLVAGPGWVDRWAGGWVSINCMLQLPCLNPWAQYICGDVFGPDVGSPCTQHDAARPIPFKPCLMSHVTMSHRP